MLRKIELLQSVFQIDDPTPMSLMFLCKQLIKYPVLDAGDQSRNCKASTSMLVYSFLSNHQEKITQYFTESICFFETFSLECVLKRQHQRLVDLVRRLKNVRNYEDHSLKSLKLDVYNIRNFSLHKQQPKELIEEDSREIDQAKSDNESEMSSEEKPAKKTNKKRTSRQKIVLHTQSGVNMIQQQADLWWKRVESKQRVEMLDPVFSNRYAETRRTLKLMQTGGDSSEHSATNSPTYRRGEKFGNAGYRDSLDLSSSRSVQFRSRQSQHGSNTNSPMTEITSFFIKIKKKKSLISAYNSFEKILYELLSAKTLHELEYLKLEEKFQSLKQKLQAGDIPRTYHLDSLRKEYSLKMTIMMDIQTCRSKYKLTRGGRQKIIHESQPTPQSQRAICTPSGNMNSAASKEFETMLRQICAAKTELSGMLIEMAESIREYLEIKESLHGFSIGDEASIFAHFVQTAAQEMNIVRPLTGIDLRFALGNDPKYKQQSPRESLHTVESKSYSSTDEEDSDKRKADGSVINGPMGKKNYSEKFSSEDESDDLANPEHKSKFAGGGGNLGNDRISSVVSLSLSPQMQRTTSITVDVLEPALVRRMTSKDDESKSRQLPMRYKRLKTMFRSSNLVVSLVSEYKTKQLLVMKCYSLVISDKSVYKNFSKPFSGTGQDEDVHDFVVRTVEMFKAGHKFYQLVEFMECGSLADLFQHYKQGIGYQEVVILLAKLLLCIEKIHSMRSAHMKINPRTVLVTANGRVKLNAIGKNLAGELRVTKI